MNNFIPNDLVSIIMPCYNGGGYLDAAVRSVIKQTYVSWELLIVDDASTDDTPRILERFSDYKNVRVIRNEKNLGVSMSRNRGLQESTGRYIAFLDSDDTWSTDKLEKTSDDLWHPEKLAKQISQLQKSNLSISCTYYDIINENGIKLGNKRTNTQRITFKDNLRFNQIGNLTGLYDCEKLGKVFQSNIGHEDYLMWMTLLRLSDCDVVSESLASYRLCGGVSSNKFKAALWHSKILFSYLDLSFHKYLFFMATYAFNGVFRR
ncbi:MAG: glycosyltransferase family 2 protein [Thalassolituus sp.]